MIWKSITHYLLRIFKGVTLKPFQLLLSTDSTKTKHSIEIQLEENQNEH